MSAPRHWRLDLSAAVVLGVGLTVAACVFATEPSRPVLPDSIDAGFFQQCTRALGQSLHDTFGVAVYCFLASWFVLVLLLFVRRSVLTWGLRLLGWLVLIPATAVGADRVGPNWNDGPLAGSGGSLGSWLSAWLDGQLNPVGVLVVLGASLLLGTLLALDFIVALLVRQLWRGVALFIRLLRWLTGAGKPRPLHAPVSKPGPIHQPLPRHLEPVAPTLEHESDEPAVETAAAPLVSGVPLSIPINHPTKLDTHERDLTLDVEPAVGSTTNTDERERFADFELPALSLLEDPQPFPYEQQEQRLRDNAALLEKTFKDFSLNVKVVGINTGPVVTQYEVALETGLRVHKVTRLADDLALNMMVPNVRIVAPIPGKNTVGVEIPNEHRAVVRLKEVIVAAAKKVPKMKVPLFIGKDTEGRPLVYDLAEMPHLLIAGRTGTGKSVCLNSIILSILMTRRPDEVKMIMIDPKQVEMSDYAKLPHLMSPIVKDVKKAEAVLAWAVEKMEERYDLLSRARVRNLSAYNALLPDELYRRLEPEDEEQRRQIPERMPTIVIFIDEVADLMMQMKKEVEGHIIRLAQKSRAAGIHVVVATQKPTVDVITGLIKSNLPARICFQVSSRTDSRVVLDEMGADRLLGKGDMLFLQPGSGQIVRAQGAYASDEEIQRVNSFLECEPCYAAELMQLSTLSNDDKGTVLEKIRARDELYEQAIEIVVREGRGSTSLLQRALGIGYGRASRMVDWMAEDGIVGTYNGSQAREVLYSAERWEQVRNAG